MDTAAPGSEPPTETVPEAASETAVEARLVIGSAALTLQQFLSECVAKGASDVHLAPDLPPYFRVHGLLEPQAHLPVTPAGMTQAIGEFLASSINRGPLPLSGSIDGATTTGDGARFRFNLFRRQGGVSIALRRLEDRFRTLADLGLPESLYELCDLPDGMVIVAGPTGAGKSTTLATLIDRINRTRRAHIVTIEDPIEYLHTPAMGLVNQRQVGADAGDFNEALVASLRQDPDVILVGEIRDLHTTRTAITAAETGHLVFTTVHASDCVGAIERMMSVFPAEEQHAARRQLSLVLRTVVAQHLIVADAGPAAHREHATLRRRRVVASEILNSTSGVSNLIALGKSAQLYSAIEAGGSYGMQTLEESLARLWMDGHITEQTATTRSRSPATVRNRAARLQARGEAG